MGGVYGGIMNAGGGGATTNFAASETPSGVINGVNPTFALAHAPSPAANVELFKNRILMLQGTDYTLAGATITYQAGSIPQGGDIHVAYYTY